MASAAPGLRSAKPGGKATASSDTVTAVSDVTGTGMSLTFNTTTVAALKAMGVNIVAAGAASVVDGGASMNFPITSGYAEVHSNHSFRPSYLLGSIEQYGSGITLATAGASVNLTAFVVDLGESMIYGTIGATEDVPLFSLVRTALTTQRSGNTLVVGGLSAALTATGASELDALFHTTAITANLAMGTVQITAAGRVGTYASTSKTIEIPRLSGIATSLTFGSAARSVFARVGTAVGAYGSATFSSSGNVVSFPITGGTAVVHPTLSGRVGYLEGVVLHQGSGIVLSRGLTSVTLTDLTVVPDASAVYASVNGGGDNADLFSMTAKTTRIKTVGGNLEVAGVTLELTTGAAAMLNSVFATSDFVPGTPLGTLELVASGR
jgi:hypothetical protein